MLIKLLIISIGTLNSVQSSNPLKGLATNEIIEYFNYPYEYHTITTSDGYILPLHRLLSSTNPNNAPPILLQPGMLSSSADWLNRGLDNALAFLLVDAGYDVWIGEQRGNRYSRQHINLTIQNNDQLYYNFSLYEVGTIDLAARIDYILDQTNVEQLFYVGHSQGTIDFFILCSEKIEYNAKMKLAILLAPLTDMKRTRSIAVRASVLFYPILDGLSKLGWSAFLKYESLISGLLEIVCGNILTSELCLDFLFLLGGKDREQIEKEFLPVIYTNFPSGTSMKLLKNILQNCKYGQFRQYDYGEQGNLISYNQSEPPSYDITKVTAPVWIYYAENDQHSVVEDIDELANQLANVVNKTLVPFADYMHLDFIWARDNGRLLYNYVVESIDQWRMRS